METEHYFTKKPKSMPKPRTISIIVNGKEILFKTSSSMFSPKKVDRATLLLIENMRPGKKVLDLGCGYGPIGITLASVCPDCSVTMSEINERAANLARENCDLNMISNAKVIKSDFFEGIVDKFDTILMNPPIAVGMKRLSLLIEECKDHIQDGGSLQIVARHKKGGSRLQNKMQEVFGNVETLVKSGGFRVYISYNSK
jgi:16S rRNA (guanine1207-N2)-methyltransferase